MYHVDPIHMLGEMPTVIVVDMEIVRRQFVDNGMGIDKCKVDRLLNILQQRLTRHEPTGDFNIGGCLQPFVRLLHGGEGSLAMISQSHTEVDQQNRSDVIVWILNVTSQYDKKDQ